MKENDQKKDALGPELIDSSIADALSDFSQRVSRRRVIAKIGKWTLTVLGVGTDVEMLPVDRRALAQTSSADIIEDLQDATCTGWKMCGMRGNRCNCCNGPQLGFAACPGCANEGSFWSACCCKPGTLPGLGTKYNVDYYDCCKGSCSEDKVAQCRACTWCANGCPQPVWGCGGDITRYVCTKVIVGSSCGSC